MRVYVAAPWGRRAEASELAKRLRLAGHTLAVDWMHQEWPGPGEEALWRAHAVEDLDGVAGSDALVLLYGPEGRGSLAEFAFALFAATQGVLRGPRAVYVLDAPADPEERARACVFLHHPAAQHVPSVEVLLKLMERRP